MKNKVIFMQIENHYNAILSGQQTKALRILVMGTAGTGKSFLIRAIRGRLRNMAGNGCKSPVLVIAPTGVAAFNINGSTIHSTLCLPINKEKNEEMNSIRLKKLQENYKTCYTS